jgi:predicted DNA-binding transcriptional regulator AlpA
MSDKPKLERVFREHELSEIDGLKSTQRNELIDQGLYPAPIKTSARRKVWLQSELERWQADRIAQRNKS